MLFDLSVDPSERHDLGIERRELLIELRGLLAKWEADVDRVPPPFVVK